MITTKKTYGMYVMPLANSLRSITDNYAKLQQTAIPATTYRDEILPQNVKGFIMFANTLEKSMRWDMCIVI